MTINDTGLEPHDYVLRNGTNGINGVNGAHSVDGYTNGTSSANGSHPGVASSVKDYVQTPIAVVGMACRLPDECHTPHAFWKFLEKGGIAKNRPPETRFNLDTHYDGSLKNKTMASPGGMFLQGVDPRDIDAQFFKLSRLEALSMDPQQRLLLEVVYEGLENSGITLEQVDSQPIGCFVGSFACDYGDMQGRDPEDRAPATVVGVGRAMLSNRISHFLNIKGPSMTIDTACSGSLTGLDVACRYLNSGEINGAIVAGANIYLSPEHVMDHHFGANGTASLSGKCHTFDAKADGYIKAEAVNMVYLKRLDEAIRDKDPIRAIIRGSATNSDGWTAGIASPNSDAQAKAIQQAYRNAGISDLSLTSYVEFHGTGTRAGDAIEAKGVASVFSQTRTPENPLRVGSVKGNIGHSEPAAGISGLMKAVLSLEKGFIPGNPTFITPNPNIDFTNLRIKPSRTGTPWPIVPFRRASVNSFGYGGSNAHVIVDQVSGIETHHVSSYRSDEADDLFDDEETTTRPYLLALSANDDKSLKGQFEALDRHLSDPSVKVNLRDLAYTLSEKRTRHYHRGFTISSSTELGEQDFVTGTVRPEPPKVGYIFTGQGAQWPQMGKDLLETYPLAVKTVRYLDDVLQSSPHPPSWTLFDELTKPQTPEHLRLPEISQPLVTALQLAILAILTASGIECHAVAGHSSGEIAAAVAARRLTPAQAIKIAYYRGQATAGAVYDTPVGMLAAGLGTEKVQPYLEGTTVQVACVNSPESVTLSGVRSDLVDLEARIKADGHFARLLQVDAAYHSRFMAPIASVYQELLEQNVNWKEPSGPTPVMYSSTTGKKAELVLGPEYWVQNMVSPVLFNQAVHQMITGTVGVNQLIEIGPSNALAGPVNQIKKAASVSIDYTSAWKRGPEALNAFLGLAGKLYIDGAPIKLSQFNADNESASPSFIIDLPNYSWNHSTKFWHENESSADWRFRKFVHHDLLGGKILGTPWTHPVWKKVLKLNDLPWLRDHKLGEGIIFPAAGYLAMAIESMYQKAKVTGRLPEETQVNEATYKLRNVTFFRAMPLEDQDKDTKILLSLTPDPSTPESWHEFVISSLVNGIITEHCKGMVCIGKEAKKIGEGSDVEPLKRSTSAAVWYKAMKDVGYSFGDSFRRLIEVETTAGSRHNRALVSCEEPPSKTRQSLYPLHPVTIDSFFQAGSASLWSGHRSSVTSLLLPAMIEDLVVYAQSQRPKVGLAVARAEYLGIGREQDAKRYKSIVSGYDNDTKELIFHLSGLRYHGLDATDERKHTYTELTWQPDVSFIPRPKLAELLQAEVDAKSDGSTDAATAKIAKVLDLIAHKNPSAKVLEASLIQGAESILLEKVTPIASQIAAGLQYRFVTSSQEDCLEARGKYGANPNVEFDVIDNENPLEVAEVQEPFALVILKSSASSPNLKAAAQNARRLLSEKGYLFILQDAPLGDLALEGFNSVIENDITGEGLQIAYLGTPVKEEHSEQQAEKELHLAHFVEPDASADGARNFLASKGWKIVEHKLPFADIPAEGTVVVLDEMYQNVMSHMSDEQFDGLKTLIARKTRLLWVTEGAQMKVTAPERSLFFGSARSIKGEDPTLLLMCLDVESHTSPASLAAIDTALRHLQVVPELETVDSEFVERDGVLHVSRVVPDSAINKAEYESKHGPELREELLQGHKSIVRLISGRTGTLDGLQYAEIADVGALPDDEVEVEVHAAALNFKDLANTMGFVPANEYLIGLECSGVIAQVGKNIEGFQPGDRVVLFRRDGGCLANRVRGNVATVHKIPDWLSFEDAATMPVCYSTAVYGLVNLANTQRGQSVLIHSASGGVGLAAINLCKYLGADIWVSVGTEKKRQFLKDQFGIPEDRMLSSRSVTFADELLKKTNGRGVDVILNSLTGDMLHESWRCIADNGVFVEIGKKDLIDRNSLSMEPFDRNASYRAFDLSRKSIPAAITKNLLSYIFKHLEEGHFKPLHTCEVFPFDKTVDAFRYMHMGKHIGKIVVSFENPDGIKIPIRPALPQLQLKEDRSYLIAGGLKGLCGSLAIYLARHGAKYLAVMSRSGYDDDMSQRIIHDLNALGAHVDLIRGDVTKIEDVRRAFASASKPVAGVIMGAMVLRDRVFNAMTPEEFRAPIEPKVAGTWNLHHVSLEQSDPLDFFTMLSSVSGVAGQKAQPNYSAGNVFQDNFAPYRHSLGLPAVAVNLGVIEDVGYFTERDHLSRRLESQGWPPINEALLHKILRFSILQQTHHISPRNVGQIITGIPVPLQAPHDPIDPWHRFSALKPGAGLASGGSGDSRDVHINMLKAAGKGQSDVDRATLLASCVEVVNSVLMRSLGAAEPLEPSRPLASYGIDSLIAVELRNWVRSELGVEISALEVVGAKTLVALCEVILGKLGA